MVRGMCRPVGRCAVVTATRCEDLPVCLIGERLVFLRAFCVVLETGGGTYKISLPEGYSWDGATIPRVWWSIMGHPLKQEFRLASLIHDWRCEHAKTGAERMVGDALFLECLERAGLVRWRRVGMWVAVRVWSLFFWRRRRG